MKLKPLRTILDTPITIPELIINYLFGGEPPIRFVEGTKYKADQLVYTVSRENDKVTIYQCLAEKVYDTIDDPLISQPNIQEITGANPETIFKNAVNFSDKDPVSGLIWIKPVNLHRFDINNLVGNGVGKVEIDGSIK